MKRQRLALEVVEAAAADAAKADGRIHVEEQREVGQHAARRSQVQLADQLGIEAASVALIGDGGVGVAIAQDRRGARGATAGCAR